MLRAYKLDDCILCLLRRSFWTANIPETTCITLCPELQCRHFEHRKRFPSFFVGKRFLTTWITTDARGTGGNGGSKEGTRVTEYERKWWKIIGNVRKKFSVPVWDHEAAGSKPVTRTRKPAEIIRFQRVSYVNCLSFAKRYSLIIAAQDLRCGFDKLELRL